MSKTRRTGHYVASTHWDREWYESFQGYRFRLVSLIDELLEVMAKDARFRYFQIDGQSIPIEDYLEIRPEREEEIRRLASEGRLRIGPWYVLPDEFLVSGESIVRNFQMGLRIAERFGTPSRAGFVCDLFGHISQLPQILRGFSIDNALLWRGTNESTHGAMFRWQSPDGSEVIAYRFSPQGGYCSYAFKVRKGQKPDEPFAMDSALAGLRELIDVEAGRCPTQSILLFDGGDHMEIEPATSALLARAAEAFDDIEIVHSHLDGFIEDLREQRDAIKATFIGELREPGEVGDDAWVIPGVLSSRIHLKQANARCENELCLWAEPFSAFAATLGRAYPHGYLDAAWKHLLQNHPHDSICGCSIDQVHKDMEYRFDQSYGIAAHLTADALAHVAARVQVPQLGEQDLALIVFNPGSDPIDGPVDLTLRFPSGIDAVYQEFFGFEPKIGFRLYDAGGKELPYQYVAQRRERPGFRRPRCKFPTGTTTHEVDVTVPMQIPAFGYSLLLCKPMKEPTRHLGSMLVDDHTIENEHLRVSAGTNGTLALLDKRSGQSYEQLLTLEDRADIGDGWYHGAAANDTMHSSRACAADVAVTADGMVRATLTIRVVMDLPERFLFDRMVRSDTRRPLVVTHDVTLRQGSAEVEVRTTVENTIRDHRLRVLFPSGAAGATSYLAEQAFDAVERPIALRADNARYKELEVETRPQQNWTAVFDDRRGLAVLSTGLPETAVRDLPDRPIALTLLRSFIRAVMAGDNEGGQIQGRHEFHYRIVPLSGRPSAAALSRQAKRLAAGLRWVQVNSRDEAASATERTLPPVHGFLRVAGDGVVVSAVTGAAGEEACTVRVFNPGDEPGEAAVALAAGCTRAARVNLEGGELERITPSGGSVRVPVKRREIVTVRLEP